MRSAPLAAWAAGLVAGIAGMSIAHPALANPGSHYEQPLDTRRLTDRGDIEVRCTWHPGLMIRERMEGPESEAATLVRGERPTCTARAARSDSVLDTAHHFLAGRKGPYLVFHALNPHGSASFVIIDARSGRKVYADMLFGMDLTRIDIVDGRLRMHYLRGVNAPCSIRAAAAACWKRLVTEGAIPMSMARQAPDAAICAASYVADNSPVDNPSIVTYEVEVEVPTQGPPKTLRRGPVDCQPMP